MGVDFVGSDGAGQGDGKNRSTYDIEYTTPKTDSDHSVKPKASFFDRFRKSSAAPKATKQTVIQANKSQVQSNKSTVNAVSSQATTPTASAPADKAYAIVEHQETPPAQTATYQPTVAAATLSSATGVAKPPAAIPGFGKKAHIIPPPPPPPVHTHETAKKINPTPTVAVTAAPHPVEPVAPPLPPIKPSVKPNLAPMPTPPAHPVLTGTPVTRPAVSGAPAVSTPTPAASIPASAPSSTVSGAPRKSTPLVRSATQDTNGNGLVIIAQNVSAFKGEMTQPQASVSSGLNVNLMSQYAANGMNGETGIVRLLRVFTMTVWFFSVAYGAMVGYQAYAIFRNEQVQMQLTQLNTEIESYLPLQAALATTNTTLTALQELLNHHIYWNNWFTFLEKYTLPNVYYTEFSGSSTGSMSLAAVTNEYEAVTQQINALKSSDFVESVEVNTATRTNAKVAEDVTTEATANETAADSTVTTDESAPTAGDGLIHFTLTVIVKPELFYYQPGQYDSANATN